MSRAACPPPLAGGPSPILLGMTLRKKIVSLLAAIAIALGVGAVTAPGIAQAALWHNCPYDTVCLYQWTNYGAPAGDANPGWKSSFGNIRNQHCINLTQPAAYWPNGTPVWDNSASLIVGGSGAYAQTDYISFYNSLNCNSGTGVTSLNANWVTGYSDLHTVPMGYGYTAYHTIASIGFTEGGPPPTMP